MADEPEEPNKAFSRVMSLEVDHTGLDEVEELAVITVMECLARADKIEQEMFEKIDPASDSVLNPTHPLDTPLMRIGTAIAVGAQEPIEEMLNAGYGAHQAVPLAIKSLVIQSFLAGIEYRKVTNPEKE